MPDETPFTFHPDDAPNGTCDDCGAPVPDAPPGEVRRCGVDPSHDPYGDGMNNGGDPVRGLDGDELPDLPPAPEDCAYVFEGHDDGGVIAWHRCTTHDELSIGDEFPCERWTDEHRVANPYIDPHGETPFTRLDAIMGVRASGSLPIGAIGGGLRPFARSVALHRDGAAIRCAIYGNRIATVYPDGSVVIAPRSRDTLTMSTSVALSHVLCGQGGASSLRTPGSKGGTPGPWSITLYAYGRSWILGEDHPLYIPSPAELRIPA